MANAAQNQTDHRLAEHVAAIRRFNRFYTRRIGLLTDGLTAPFSLAEARVLYELAHRDQPTAAVIGRDLGLDAGYLSRILQGFAERGLIARAKSPADGRQTLLSLTPRGREAFGPLEARADDQVAAMLQPLPSDAQRRLAAAMGAIESLLAPNGKDQTYILRPHQPGDMGWVVREHGLLYAEEYGWDTSLEGFVAAIVVKFLRDFDPQRERCWIAERQGELVGSVFVMSESRRVAKLRLLLVKRAARGLGIGGRLVDECIRFARQVGYRKLTLWTNRGLDAARHIYEAAGFKLMREEPHQSFGKNLVGQYWELPL